MGKLSSLLATSVVAGAALMKGVNGHGYMTFPRPRNAHTHNWCAHCANGREVCGGGPSSQWRIMDADVTLGPVFPRQRTQIPSGGILEVEMGLTVAHLGVFEVQLCANPGARITEDCFVPLERDPSDTRWAPYISEAPTLAYMLENKCMGQTSPTTRGRQLHYRFRIPPNIVSEHAIVRWIWQTGNSCSPNPSLERLPVVRNFRATFQGMTCAAATSNGSACGSRQCPHHSCGAEQFRNCADVQIVPGPGQTVTSSRHTITPGMPSSNPTTPSTTPVPVTTPTRPTTPATTPTRPTTPATTPTRPTTPATTPTRPTVPATTPPQPTSTPVESPPDSGNGGGGGGNDTPSAGCLTDTAHCIANVRSNLSATFIAHCQGRCNWVSDPSTALHQICVQRNICSVLDCVVAMEGACTK